MRPPWVPSGERLTRRAPEGYCRCSMPTAPAKSPPDDERSAGVRRRVTSLVYAAYVAFTIGFILLCTKSIMAGVFHPEHPQTLDTRAGKACADGVRTLAAALDRGMIAAVSARDEVAASSAFQQAIASDWEREASVGTECKADPRGADAFAALLRLRRAQEGFLGRQLVEIAPLRRDVEAYLPH